MESKGQPWGLLESNNILELHSSPNEWDIRYTTLSYRSHPSPPLVSLPPYIWPLKARSKTSNQSYSFPRPRMEKSQISKTGGKTFPKLQQQMKGWGWDFTRACFACCSPCWQGWSECDGIGWWSQWTAPRCACNQGKQISRERLANNSTQRAQRVALQAEHGGRKQRQYLGPEFPFLIPESTQMTSGFNKKNSTCCTTCFQ